MVPSPASATTTTVVGFSASISARLSPSSAIGERSPPAVSTKPTSMPAGHVSSVTRSATTTRRSGDGMQGGDEPVDVGVGVGGRQRDPQASGPRGDRRRPDGGYEQALVEQRGGGGERASVVTQHDRDDRRRVARADAV